MTLFEQGPEGAWPPVRQQPHQQARRPRISAVWSTVVGIAFVVVCGAGLLVNAPSLTASPLDPYTMSEEVVQLADRMGLSEEGRVLFTQSRPQVLDAEPFLDVCGDATDAPDEWYPAGCYFGIATLPGEIAIYRQPDARFADYRVVVATHELLHAAYDRLTSVERSPLDALLEARWSQIPAEDPIQVQFAGSVGLSTENRATEQFAYIGSQVFDGIDPALESYFAPYFADRTAVAAAGAAHEAMWAGLRSDLQTAGDALVAQEQAAIDQRWRWDADRAQLDVDRTGYNLQVEHYNAQTPEQRAQWFAVLPDGTQKPLETRLAEVLVTINARDAELSARQAQVDAADAAAQAARTALEQRHADYIALAASSAPSAG